MEDLERTQSVETARTRRKQMDLSLLSYGSPGTMRIQDHVVHVTPLHLGNTQHLDIAIGSVSPSALHALTQALALKLMEATRLISLRVSCDALGACEEKVVMRLCVLLGHVKRLDLSTLYPCTAGVMRMLSAFTSLGELHINLLPVDHTKADDVVTVLASDARSAVSHLEVHECGAVSARSLAALYHLPYLRRIALHRLVTDQNDRVLVPSHLQLSLTRVPGTRIMDRQYSFVRHQEPHTFTVYLCRVDGYQRPVMPTTVGLDAKSVATRALQRQELGSNNLMAWNYRDFTSSDQVALGHFRNTGNVAV